MSPRPTPGSISSRMLLRVAQFCQARGHDPETLCRSVGLSFSALSEPDARIPYEAAQRLGERALQVTDDDAFGLHLAADVRDTGSFDAGMLLLMASPTVRVALDRMVSYQRYWGDGDRAVLRSVRGGAAIRYDLRGVAGAYARHADECAMAEIALGVRVLSGKPLEARVVRFRHETPRATAEHDALFGCPIVFGQSHTEIVFDDVALDALMEHANEIFATIFERQVKSALARLPAASSASTAVHQVTRAALSAGGCSLDRTARALGVSTRSLQRRLREEGTSFGAIVEALRREMASAYLERGLPRKEVASLLGYADATAFHRAFRRWTGATPGRCSAES